VILIVTSKQDGHVEAVSNHLTAAGAPWIRVNIEDFATNVEIDVDPATGSGWLTVKDSRKAVNLQDVGAVWYRKPEPVDVKHFELDPAALEYVEAEFTEVILGLYAILSHAYWINNPFTTRVAHRKLLQLKVASEVGFAVPHSLLTNRLESALAFASGIKSDLAIKSLGAISVTRDQIGCAIQYGIFTRRMTPAELSEFGDKICHMPTLFQQFISKDSELRITCVGEQVFACRILTRTGDITNDDYRFNTLNLEHKAIECPELTGRIHAYMKALSLNFACFDFIVSTGGESVFLEANCNGQWLWIERRTGLPIGRAIANELLRHALMTGDSGSTPEDTPQVSR